MIHDFFILNVLLLVLFQAQVESVTYLPHAERHDNLCGPQQLVSSFAYSGISGFGKYPSKHQSDFQCKWIIQASDSKIIQINLIYNSYDSQIMCNGRFLGIENGDELVGTFCAVNIPYFIFRSTNSTVKITYYSKRNAFSSFHFRWAIVGPEEAEVEVSYLTTVVVSSIILAIIVAFHLFSYVKYKLNLQQEVPSARYVSDNPNVMSGSKETNYVSHSRDDVGARLHANLTPTIYPS